MKDKLIACLITLAIIGINITLVALLIYQVMNNGDYGFTVVCCMFAVLLDIIYILQVTIKEQQNEQQNKEIR